MIKKLALTALTALALTTGGAYAAGGGEQHIEDFAFSFEGPFGKFDQEQLRRGLKIYTEVCSACHGMKFLNFRNLGDDGGPHYTADEVRAYAEGFDVFDPALDDTRPATPADKFPPSNLENAPDLTLMAKARAGFHGPAGLGINQIVKGMGGPEYIASILTGYTGEEKEQAGSVFYENTAFPGGWIAMAPPLSEELVDFDDGHSNSAHHMAEDVSAFLMWTAEPKMMARKQAGFTGVLFLTIFAVLMYLTNKRLWAPIKKKAKEA
ncbi:MAG: cytochrome c1 [Pseudoruegeria sp.]